MNKPTIIRTCECQCGNKWTYEVGFSPTTPNLTGETRRTCPKCGDAAKFSSQWRLLVGGRVYSMEIGVEIKDDDSTTSGEKPCGNCGYPNCGYCA